MPGVVRGCSVLFSVRGILHTRSVRSSDATLFLICFLISSSSPGYKQSRWRLALLQAAGVRAEGRDWPAQVLAGDLRLPPARGASVAIM